MIIKSMTRKSAGGMKQLIHYVCGDAERLKVAGSDPLVVTHNLRGDDLNAWTAEFYVNEEGRITERSDSVYMYHDIISFHALDAEHLDAETLRAFAYHYIDLKSVDALSLAAAHIDRDHVHLHVVSSGIKLNGKSAWISKQEFKELKIEMDRFCREQYPQIKHSFVQHGTSDKGKLKENDPKLRWQDKDMLAEHLDRILAKSDSREDFLQRAKDEGIEVYERNGKATGVLLEGRKYRFTTLGIDVASAGTPREKTNKELLDDLETGTTGPAAPEPDSESETAKEIPDEEVAESTEDIPEVEDVASEARDATENTMSEREAELHAMRNAQQIQDPHIRRQSMDDLRE